MSGLGGRVDFVVVGLGLGALMMLAGFALRDLGPWLFGSANPNNSLPEFEQVKATIRKQTLASIGTAIATAGVGLAIVTFSALIAKTDDEIGTIVVGMSLALAAVGIGAWTYDAIRRYRAAMDMVSGQEESVMSRFAPTTVQATTKTRKPSTLAPSTQSSRRQTDPENDEPMGDEPPVSAEDDEAMVDRARPSDVIEEPSRPESDRPTVDVPPDLEVDDEAEDQEIESSWVNLDDEEPASTSDEDLELPWHTRQETSSSASPIDAADDLDNTRDDVSTLQSSEDRSQPLTRPTVSVESDWKRSPAAKPAATDRHEFTELPPLPEEGDDALIDESVRFDFGPAQDRKVPSWLFDDLETDLRGAGTSKPDDPVDQFRGATRVSRGSALDRLMADEPAKKGNGSDSDEEPDDGDSDAD